MTIEEIQLSNIESAKRWIKSNHPEISEDSLEYTNFMAEMGRRNDGVFGRGCAFLNGRDFSECWEKIHF